MIDVEPSVMRVMVSLVWQLFTTQGTQLGCDPAKMELWVQVERKAKRFSIVWLGQLLGFTFLHENFYKAPETFLVSWRCWSPSIDITSPLPDQCGCLFKYLLSWTVHLSVIYRRKKHLLNQGLVQKLEKTLCKVHTFWTSGEQNESHV